MLIRGNAVYVYVHLNSAAVGVYVQVMTTGSGVNGFTLDPSLGTFFLSHPNMHFPVCMHTPNPSSSFRI